MGAADEGVGAWPTRVGVMWRWMGRMGVWLWLVVVVVVLLLLGNVHVHVVLVVALLGGGGVGGDGGGLGEAMRVARARGGESWSRVQSGGDVAGATLTRSPCLKDISRKRKASMTFTIRY